MKLLRIAFGFFLIFISPSSNLKAQTSAPIYRLGHAEVLRNGVIQAYGSDTGGKWEAVNALPALSTSKEPRTFYLWDGEKVYRFRYGMKGEVFLQTFELIRREDGHRAWTFRSPQRLPDHTYPMLA